MPGAEKGIEPLEEDDSAWPCPAHRLFDLRDAAAILFYQLIRSLKRVRRFELNGATDGPRVDARDGHGHLDRAAHVFAREGERSRAYHQRGSRAVWTVPLIMVAWANLHGGFLAGPVIVATAAVGHAVSGPWDQARLRRRSSR